MNCYYHKSQNRHSGMDRRNPVAMDGNYKAFNQLIYSLILINSMQCRLVHPCKQDAGTNLSGTDLHLPAGQQAG